MGRIIKNDVKGDDMDNLRENGCCVICNKPNEEGITILEQFICNFCEKEMLTTDVEDERYGYFVVQLRSLLCGSEA